MSRIRVPDLALSCWIIEAARSSVLAGRGHAESGVRAAERARLLARVCAAEGVKIQPGTAGEHARWMAQVAGSHKETGALGRIFLQRLGVYVDAYMKDSMPPLQHARMAELSAVDLEEVNDAVAREGFPEIPEDDWPPSQRGGEAEAATSALAGGGTRFGILADPHIEQEGSSLVVRGLGALASEGVHFTVVPGDVTKSGDRASFQLAARLFAGASAPVLCTLGNHDMTVPATGPPAPGRFEAEFKTKPYGEHQRDGVRVILLDSAVPAVSPFPPFDVLGGDFTDAPAAPVAWGDFSREVSDWMAGLGPSASPTFVFLHHPPYPYPGFPPLVFGLGKESTEQLGRLVEATSARAVFCGHTHRSATRLFRGVPLIEVPSASHWPFCAGIVDVALGPREKGGWSFRLHRIAGSPGRAKDHAEYLFRRYAAGDRTAHTFSDPF